MAGAVLDLFPDAKLGIGPPIDGGFYYDFESALVDGMILPASPSNPGVFELKNPNQNIKGVVR